MEKRKKFPERPRRLTFIHRRFTNPVYFITFCTYRRCGFLAVDPVFQAFTKFSLEASERGISVGRFVIMPDHVHLFVRLNMEMRLGRWIAGLKQTLSKAGGHSRSDSRVWQEGFFDHVLRSAASYGQKWEYVRQNPVRAGLVKRSELWPYQGEIVPIEGSS